MKTFYAIVGISGIGKSSYVKHLADKTGAVVICPDNIRAELCGNESDQSKNGLIFTVIVPKRIAAALNSGNRVIFDATSPDKMSRKALINLAVGVRKECHYFEPDVKRAIKQNALRDRKVPEDVIRKQAAKFVTPTHSEGFDIIYNVSKEEFIAKPRVVVNRDDNYYGTGITGFY